LLCSSSARLVAIRVSIDSAISLGSIRRPALFCAAVLMSAGVCLPPASAQILQSSPAAKLVKMSGQVSVLRGNATWALNVGDMVQPQQVIVTGPDGSAVFQVLADGSTFEVFPNSKAVFRESAGNWEELLKVWLGRVRVQIQHFGNIPNHNKVRTETAVVSVRGTIFDVTVEDDQGTTLVVVEEGKVNVRHLIQGGEKSLSAGEWVEIFWNQPLAANKVDHGAILMRLANIARDTIYEAVIRQRTGTPTGTPGTTSGGQSSDKNGQSTDKSGGGSTSGGGAPPPPPPPPPPPGPQ